MVSIGGKEFKTKSKYSSWKKIMELYPDIEKAADWNLTKYYDFIVDSLMVILEDNPFKTREELADALDMDEVQALVGDKINQLVFGKAVAENGKRKN
jgi:hypothetical protein